MERFGRNFSGRHPLFREKMTDTGIWWENSEYYLWWEFLRRNEDYKIACLRKNKGKFSMIFADFGDVSNVDFKSWFNKGDRGKRLFAEPLAPIGVAALSLNELRQMLEEGVDGQTVIVSIPLHYRHRYISRQISLIVKKANPRKRGEKRFKTSKALYPLAGPCDRGALKITLRCWDLKQKYPELKLWEVAQEVGVAAHLSEKELNAPRNDLDVAAKKRSMTVGVSRKLKHAERIIEAVGRGVFPVR